VSDPIPVVDLAGAGDRKVSLSLDMRGTLIEQSIVELAMELAAADPTMLARRPAVRQIVETHEDKAFVERFYREFH
jgi:hypothetical protein